MRRAGLGDITPRDVCLSNCPVRGARGTIGRREAYATSATRLSAASLHASHIYQKLGVHSKDEMLELVEDRAARG